MALVAVQIKNARLCLNNNQIWEQKTWKKDIVCVAPYFLIFVFLQTAKIFTLGRKMGKYIYLFNMKGSTILLPVLGNKQIYPEVSKVQTAGSLAPNHTSTKLQSQD